MQGTGCGAQPRLGGNISVGLWNQTDNSGGTRAHKQRWEALLPPRLWELG